MGKESIKHTAARSTAKASQGHSRRSVLITLTLGLCICFGALLYLTRLSAERIPTFDESDPFHSLSQVKRSVVPTFFSWLYTSQLEDRAIRLDKALINRLQESRLRLLKTLKHSPRSHPPSLVTQKNKDFTLLSDQVSQVKRWLDSGQLMSETRQQAQEAVQQGEQLLFALRNWIQSLETLSTGRETLTQKPRSKGMLAALSLRLMAELKNQNKSPTFEVHVEAILDQYHLAWYRHWATEALHELTMSHSKILNNQPRKQVVFERLQKLKGIYRDLQTLSISLANLVYFKVLRASQSHWQTLWNLVTQELETQLDEEQRLKALSDFGHDFDVLQGLRGVVNTENSDPTSIPQTVVDAWRQQFTSLSDITFAISLQNQERSNSIVGTRIAKEWFMPLLEADRAQRVQAEFKGLALRDLLKKHLASHVLKEDQLIMLRDQLTALKGVSSTGYKWTARLKEVTALLEPSWRSVRGRIDCDEEAMDIGDSWRDLGLLDTLAPSLYLVSKKDKALLSRRVGRIYWSVKRHHLFKVRVYDEDKVTDPDLLFISSMPTILQMILTQPVKIHGCAYTIELLNTESIATWLRD